jgi:hypothetical protein
MLSPDIPRGNVSSAFDNICFIIFNYDRCVEYFLLHALQKLYGMESEEEAKAIVDNLDIEHPYGVIDRNIPFGAIKATYHDMAESIKIYTEQAANAVITDSLIAKVKSATHIVFLGFAFHNQNMKLLKPTEPMTASKRIFGTAYGMSDSDVNVVGQEIDSWLWRSQYDAVKDAGTYRTLMIKIENKLKCADLFDHYAKSLTGG